MAGYSTPKDVARPCLAAEAQSASGVIKYGPQRFDGWMTVVQNSGKAHRTYGIYEEKFFPERMPIPRTRAPSKCERTSSA